MVNVEPDPGGFMVATLDDGKANALSAGVIADLRKAVATAVEAGQPLVIAGRDGVFCAGFDLRVMTGADREAMVALVTDGAHLFREIIEAPVPVMAACTGHALAAGAGILLSVDHRIGRRGEYKIGLNEVRINMALPPFAMALVRARLDPRHLTAATMFAEVASPERALEIGYLDEVVDDPLSAARTLGAELAELPRKAFAQTKHLLREPLLRELDAGLL